MDTAIAQGAACRTRRERLADELKRQGLGAAVLLRPQHLTYFFGLSGWRSQPAAGLIGSDGSNILSLGTSADRTPFADAVVRFDDSYFKTSVEDRERLSVTALEQNLQSTAAVGSDVGNMLDMETRPLTSTIARMRRHKDQDEVALISQAVVATEAGYRAIASQVRPGLLETELYALFQAATTVAAGSPMGELGNDFRGGHPGGRPRQQPLTSGDLLPVDAGAVIGGYYADLCRTFAVSGERSAAQDEAFGHVMTALSEAEALIAPGTRCRDVFAQVHSRLDGKGGWRFDHHLGHGIGLGPVERPFINADSDDVFEDGDTFTLEPGLYGPDLREGIRLEQNYVMEGGKLRRLSTLQLDFHA